MATETQPELKLLSEFNDFCITCASKFSFFTSIHGICKVLQLIFHIIGAIAVSRSNLPVLKDSYVQYLLAMLYVFYVVSIIAAVFASLQTSLKPRAVATYEAIFCAFFVLFLLVYCMGFHLIFEQAWSDIFSIMSGPLIITVLQLSVLGYLLKIVADDYENDRIRHFYMVNLIEGQGNSTGLLN